MTVGAEMTGHVTVTFAFLVSSAVPKGGRESILSFMVGFRTNLPVEFYTIMICHQRQLQIQSLFYHSKNDSNFGLKISVSI